MLIAILFDVERAVCAAGAADGAATDSGETGKKAARPRTTLPRQVTDILKAWLFEHHLHPYPNEEQREQLARRCNLPYRQLKTWFTNARKRLLQPPSAERRRVLLREKSRMLGQEPETVEAREALDRYLAYVEGSKAAVAGMAERQASPPPEPSAEVQVGAAAAAAAVTTTTTTLPEALPSLPEALYDDCGQKFVPQVRPRGGRIT